MIPNRPEPSLFFAMRAGLTEEPENSLPVRWQMLNILIREFPDKGEL